MRLLIVLALLVAGCGGVSAPKPVIEEFSRDVVRVQVPYTASGPQGDRAQTAADEMAKRFCQSYGRKTDFASFFHERGGAFSGGAFYFLYRCVK